MDKHRLDVELAVRQILYRRPAVGLALGIVRDGRLDFFHGHGRADIASNRPITPDTVFRIASITKTFTAIAILQLWEQGRIDLDGPADDYLTSYRLVPSRPGWGPPTVRHLLTHTAGLGEMAHPSGLLRPDFGESVPEGERIPPLAEFYGGALRIDVEPGVRFRYGDHSHATLGQILEDVTGEPLDRYLRAHVFAPLGMDDTDLVRSPAVRAKLATGYRIGAGGARVVAERDFITAGAASAYSTPRDMARYLAALLGGGGNEHGTVLAPETMADMFAPHYQPDPRMPGIGLSFFRAEIAGHRVIEHQGILPGFDSQVYVAPDDGVAVMAFSNGTRRGMLWMPTELSDLLAAVLDEPADTVRTDVAHRPDVWSDICGWYHLPSRLTDARVRAMVGAGVEVVVRRGQLTLRVLSPVPRLARGFVLHPDDAEDPYVFRIDLSEFELGSIRVVFSPDTRADAMAIHLDIMPLTGHRRPAWANPRRWTNGAMTIAVATAAIQRSRRHRPFALRGRQQRKRRGDDDRQQPDRALSGRSRCLRAPSQPSEATPR
jgi:CubicO group peptidase (beta-lactamase class C family)